MSIFVGQFGNLYDVNTLTQNLENYLVLNRFDNSHVIYLNIDHTSSSDAVINYKNRYLAGCVNGSFAINDYNNNYLNINPTITNITNKNVIINNLINIINNQIIFNLTSTSSFNIYNNNNKNIFNTSNNNINIGNNNDINNINIGNNININNTTNDINITNGNIKLNSGSLYTGNIYGYNGGNIRIHNAIFDNFINNSANFQSFVNIINDSNNINYPNNSLLIKRYLNNYNIVDIFTCNINKPIIRNFCIDPLGNVSIGSNLPNAMLYITPESHHSNVIYYNDVYNSNSFIVTNKGYIGIGTSIPNGFLNIIRNDNNNNIINYPLINLDINYNIKSNYVSSKIINTSYYAIKTSQYIYDTNDNIISINPNYINNNYSISPINYTSTPSNIPNATNSYSYSFNFRLGNNEILYNNPNNNNVNFIISNYQSQKNNYISINNTFYFPSIFNSDIYHVQNNILSPDININGTQITYTFNSSIALVSNKTFLIIQNTPNLYTYNQQNFYSITNTYNILTVDNEIFKYVLTIYIELGTFNYSFINYDKTLLNPPDLFYATSNNTFSSSISSTGKLNIGSKDLTDFYDLYTLGNSRIDNITCYNLKSIPGKNNINFNNNNISNINKSFSTSNINKFIYSDNTTFNNANINYLKNFSIYSSTISANNITSTNILNTNYNITNNNALFKMPIFIGNVIDNNNNSYFKINVDYNYTNGVEISSYNNLINPSLSINTNVNNYYPSINLKSTNCSYYMCISSNNYSANNYYEGFQIYNMINNNSNVLFQHHNNTISIGNNNILADVSINTNSSFKNINNNNNKISIGYPVRFLYNNNQLIPSLWYNYYNDSNKTNTNNMFNVYGSFNFSSINNNPLIRCNITGSDSTEFINIGIGTTPDSNKDNTLLINGNTTFLSNINCCNVINTQNCYVYNSLLAANIGSLSDLKIKTDLHIIENSLDIIKNISGYRYNRIDTKRKEIGLIAQEVNKVLPELISNDKDLLHISYGNFAGVFVECIKDLNDKIDKLDKKLEDMRLKNDLL